MEKTSLVSLLRVPPPPPEEYRILSTLRLDTIAYYLKISPQYLSNIVSGTRRPSFALHNRIMDIVKQVESEMAQSQNRFNESALMDIVAGGQA
jgi:hypothetical protein